MNRLPYTILIAVLSVGITLAFVAGCHKKCVCNDVTTEQVYTGEDQYDDTSDDNTSNGENAGENSRNKGNSVSDRKAAVKTPVRSSADVKKNSPVKYGDAETGGNVYTVGGVEPNPGSPGSAGNKDTSKVKKSNLKPANVPKLKTAADGQRN